MRLSCNYTVDIDECISNPCSKNDPCNDSIDGRGYFAILDIDECISNPCSNNLVAVIVDQVIIKRDIDPPKTLWRS